MGPHPSNTYCPPPAGGVEGNYRAIYTLFYTDTTFEVSGRRYEHLNKYTFIVLE